MSQQTNQVPDDQLTPEEVIEKLKLIVTALLKNWKALVIIPILGFGIGFAMDQIMKNPPEYEANVVFNLGGSQSGGGGFGDLAGMFGIGGAPDANIFTGENFFYFVKSRPVIEANLMKEIEVDGKKVLMINYFIENSGILDDEWENREDNVRNFRFTERNPAKLDIPTRMILNEVVNKARLSTDIGEFDRKSTFIQLSAHMQGEKLTALWITNLLDTVEKMYTENQTKKTTTTLQLLEQRADSLGRKLGVAERGLARQMDNSQQIIFSEAKISTGNMERKTAFLQTLYYETLGNIEKMRVSLIREAPLFTKIEDIKTPLDAKVDAKTKSKIGALIGLLLALAFIYFKTVFTSTKASKVAGI